MQVSLICIVLLVVNILTLHIDNKDHTHQSHPEEKNGELEDFDITIWPPMKRVLCVKGAPNLRLASLLFRLARFEVFEKGFGEPYGTGERLFAPTRQLDSFWTDKDDKDKRGPMNENVRNFFAGDGTKNQNGFFAGDFGGATLVRGWNENGMNVTTLYVRIYKCANKQIKYMENELAKRMNFGGGQEEILTLSEALDRVKESDPRNQHRSNVSAATDMLPPPCIYTAVRDPISHFLSGYNEVEFRIATGEEFGHNIKTAPYHFRIPYSKSSPDLRRKRFQALVEDLLLEEPILSYQQYKHFFPMSRVLSVLATHGVALTGYIPTIANVTSTWPEFMSSTCQGYPTREKIEKVLRNDSAVELANGGHRSSLDKLGFYEAAKEVWREGGPIARALCLLHAFDYACFEDLPEGIPELCRAVYREYSDEIALNHSNTMGSAM